MGLLGFPGGSVVKNLPVNVGDMGLIPESRRPPEVGNGNPLEYYYLENSMNRGAWRATVHGVAKSRAQLNTHTHTHTHINTKPWDSPGGLVVKTLHFHYRGCRFNPWFENKILHATQLHSED